LWAMARWTEGEHHHLLAHRTPSRSGSAPDAKAADRQSDR
jgi:hypothetical protein